MQSAPGWLRWQDGVDVLLVSFVLYRAFLVIKGTRAVQILLGLAVLVITYVVSDYFEFFTLHWILNGFLSSILLVVVVLFQNDIRRALSHMGTNSLWFSREGAPADALAVEELTKASVSLAHKKIGALIAVQRQTELRDHAEQGVSIDGELTKELLLSIFLPYSPLHDGAVIVKGRRITWAGCFLPLSSRPDLDKDFGTRHRAAVGLTEDTDALVLVVSEERGSVSLVADGRVMRDLDPATLRQELSRRMGGAPGVRRLPSAAPRAEAPGVAGD